MSTHLTIHRAAKRLGVDEEVVRGLIRDGHLKCRGEHACPRVNLKAAREALARSAERALRRLGGGVRAIATSPDGVTWTSELEPVTTPLDRHVDGVVWNGRKFVAVVEE